MGDAPETAAPPQAADGGVSGSGGSIELRGRLHADANPRRHARRRTNQDDHVRAGADGGHGREDAGGDAVQR